MAQNHSAAQVFFEIPELRGQLLKFVEDKADLARCMRGLGKDGLWYVTRKLYHTVSSEIAYGLTLNSNVSGSAGFRLDGLPEQMS